MFHIVNVLMQVALDIYEGTEEDIYRIVLVIDLESSVDSITLFPCYIAVWIAAIVSGGKGTAQDKIKTLREAGVTVVESPAKIGVAMLDVFKQRGLV